MDHGRTHTWLTQLARTAGWHRRLLAGGLAAAAVALTIHALEPAPERTTPVVVATRDLPGGSTLTHDDVEVIGVPAATRPDAAMLELRAVVGQRVAGPVRAGEMVTDVRLLTGALVDGWGDDLVAVPVRFTDPTAVHLVQPGDLIDIVAAPAAGVGSASLLAEEVPVLSVPPPSDHGLADGAILIVAATSNQVLSLAEAAVTARLSIALRGS